MNADDRRKLTIARLKQLAALVEQWERDLLDEEEPVVDGERDVLIEHIMDLLYGATSPAVRAQRAIIRAVVAARRYEKLTRRSPKPQPPGVERALAVESMQAQMEVRGVNGVRARVDAYTPGALAKVDDKAIESAIAGKPRADASILALLKAAGVPLTGRNPGRMIRKYGYGN